MLNEGLDPEDADALKMPEPGDANKDDEELLPFEKDL